jgi:hypothetical protein
MYIYILYTVTFCGFLWQQIILLLLLIFWFLLIFRLSVLCAQEILHLLELVRVYCPPQKAKDGDDERDNGGDDEDNGDAKVEDEEGRRNRSNVSSNSHSSNGIRGAGMRSKGKHTPPTWNMFDFFAVCIALTFHFPSCQPFLPSFLFCSIGRYRNGRISLKFHAPHIYKSCVSKKLY